MTTLAELGWTAEFAVAEGLRPARVASVHAVRLDVLTEGGPLQASLRSKAFDSVVGGISVGDWVALDGDVVDSVLPRKTVFLRQAAGEKSVPQAIAANIDRVFVVTSLNEEFNVRRLERYLVAIASGGAEVEIILTKADIAEDFGPVEEAKALTHVIVTSARSGQGMDDLRARIPAGITAALVGSSGVGKSALLNHLLGHEAQLEGEVRSYDQRGRHTTTRRELFVLPGAGLLIDTPGMRELKPWISPTGDRVQDAFDDVLAVAEGCRYRDCLHAGEPGCAVLEAVENKTLDAARVASWQKLARERAALASRVRTRRR